MPDHASKAHGVSKKRISKPVSANACGSRITADEGDLSPSPIPKPQAGQPLAEISEETGFSLTFSILLRILLSGRGVGFASAAEGVLPSESPSGPGGVPDLPGSPAPSVTPYFELPEGLSFILTRFPSADTTGKNCRTPRKWPRNTSHQPSALPALMPAAFFRRPQKKSYL